MKIWILFLSLWVPAMAWAQMGGFNLSETDTMKYDAAVAGGAKTEAQLRVDEIKKWGTRHVVLNVRGRMITGRGNEVVSMTPPNERADEARRLIRLIQYIKQQGMTVGIRPIFFVFGPNGEFPFYETLPEGRRFLWWHGNIQPSDPNRWFESFRTFLDPFISLAKVTKADEFTIGAELYSMTVGIEDQWLKQPYGFPGRWLALLRYVRGRLPQARLMYDINFTDDSNTESGFAKSGGELERWRYRLVDLANPTNPNELAIWQDLVAFWRELDAIGIDMYRSLASRNDALPTDFHALVAALRQRTDSYASQLDSTLTEIAMVTGFEKKVYFKEIGYRSVEQGFIDPFVYAGQNGTLNLMHQATAYEAFLSSFWDVGWSWFAGVSFWDISVDPKLHGPQDKGFSPIGKKATEEAILRRYRP